MYQDAILLIPDWADFLGKLEGAGGSTDRFTAGPARHGNGGAVTLVRFKEAEATFWEAQAEALGVQIVARSPWHDASQGTAIGAALIASLTEAQQEALQTVIDLSPRSDGEGGTVQPTLASEMVLIQ